MFIDLICFFSNYNRREILQEVAHNLAGSISVYRAGYTPQVVQLFHVITNTLPC